MAAPGQGALRSTVRRLRQALRRLGARALQGASMRPPPAWSGPRPGASLLAGSWRALLRSADATEPTGSSAECSGRARAGRVDGCGPCSGGGGSRRNPSRQASGDFQVSADEAEGCSRVGRRTCRSRGTRKCWRRCGCRGPARRAEGRRRDRRHRRAPSPAAKALSGRARADGATNARVRVVLTPMSVRALRRLFDRRSALLLVGCGLRFAYSQLDWLLQRYLRDYVTLDAGQRGEFDRRLAGLLDWHCRSHLPSTSPCCVRRTRRWRPSASGLHAARTASLERGGALARGSSGTRARAAQAGGRPGRRAGGELAAAFARRGEGARGFLSGDESAQHAARVGHAGGRLRRWFGRMTPAQRSASRRGAGRRSPRPRPGWRIARAGRPSCSTPCACARTPPPSPPAWRWRWRRARRWTAASRGGRHNRALELLAELHALSGEATPPCRTRSTCSPPSSRA